jgi:hypothetical protein
MVNIEEKIMIHASESTVDVIIEGVACEHYMDSQLDTSNSTLECAQLGIIYIASSIGYQITAHLITCCDHTLWNNSRMCYGC